MEVLAILLRADSWNRPSMHCALFKKIIYVTLKLHINQLPSSQRNETSAVAANLQVTLNYAALDANLFGLPPLHHV